MSNNHFNKFESAVWGFIIGDAMGVPFEFSYREELSKYPVTDMVGFGTHFQPPGTWSDDTSMMLCVMEYLCEEGEQTKDYWVFRSLLQQKKLATKFLDWYKNGAHTASGEIFDIGITTQTALEAFSKGTKTSECGVLNVAAGCGNGSLMRTLPIAYFFREDKVSLRNLIGTRIGKITHRTILTSVCISFYNEFFFSLLNGDTKLDALKHAQSAITYIIRHTDGLIDDESIKLLTRMMQMNFGLLKSDEIKSGGYVIETLEAAIWSFLNTNSFSEAVLLAINLGGDTDTIGALTGGLAGCYYQDGIPENWKEKIQNKLLIESILLKVPR